MNPEASRLYELLPALYRIRDTELARSGPSLLTSEELTELSTLEAQGSLSQEEQTRLEQLRDKRDRGPLRSLITVLAEQIAVMRENLEQLYDDQFIETCTEWVVPYIGDLIGYRTLHGASRKTRNRRAEVANTIAYRRRKGTATVLEQLARDVTGWHARAVEFFQYLITTQYMNHIRRLHRTTPDLRLWEPLERLGGPFDSIPRTVDVRRIETGAGRYNIPNVGLFLWRLQSFRVRRSPAFKLDGERFLFSPLGNNMRLFTRPDPEEEISHLAGPMNVPEPISRRVLHAHLGRYYGRDLSLFVEADNSNTAIANIEVCDLSDDASGWAHMPVTKIVIDPELGRLAFPPNSGAENVRVTFHYGFSADMGGGEYERRSSFAIDAVATETVEDGNLQNALTAAASGGVVEIKNSGRYEETPAITVTAAAEIELRAANETRPVLVLNGDLVIHLAAGSKLSLNGLLITGGRVVVVDDGAGGPCTLQLRHCTLVPGHALTPTGEPISAEASLLIHRPGTTVRIEQCIVGRIGCAEDVNVTIRDSIVDATTETDVAFADPLGNSAGGALTVENTTMIGRVHTARLDLASNTIFLAQADGTHPVLSEQKQQGCVRFSYLPAGSLVPKRYRCQPDLAISKALSAADQPPGTLSDPESKAISAEVRARFRPVFTNLRYGQPGYGQLAPMSAAEIRTGADDESEMGAFHNVFAPQREANLRIRLDEYLRFGLEAGILYAS
jgi:hypothetical protein